MSAACLSAAMAPASASKALIRARSASRSANGPTPQNRSATILASPMCCRTSRAKVCSPAAVACRNEPGGKVTRARPIIMVGVARCAISSPCRVSRASLWASARRANHAHPRGVQGARAADVHVDAGVGRGRLDVERLFCGSERLGDRPGGGNRAIERGRQHRAAVDPDDVMRAQRGEADFDDVARAAAGVKRGAAAAFAVGVDQLAHRRVEAGLRQRRRPPDRASIRDSGPSVQCWIAQPPQIAEMRAERRDSLRARRARPAADGGDPDGRATRSTSTVSPGSV